MLIIWGSRLFGKVDDVPGMFHVATKFFHLWYIPLIPLGSVVVVGKEAGSYRGAPIGLSVKSMFAAWARAGLIVFGVVTAIGGVAGLSDTKGSKALAVGVIAVGVTMVGLAVFSWFARGVGRASYKRAVVLAEKVGMTEEGLVLIELAYGRVTRADAEAALVSLRDSAERMEAIATDTGEARFAPPTAPPAAAR